MNSNSRVVGLRLKSAASSPPLMETVGVGVGEAVDVIPEASGILNRSPTEVPSSRKLVPKLPISATSV